MDFTLKHDEENNRNVEELNNNHQYYNRLFLPLSRGVSENFSSVTDNNSRTSSTAAHNTNNTSPSVRSLATNYSYDGYNRRRRRSTSLGQESDLTKTSPKTIRKQISFILEEGNLVIPTIGSNNNLKNHRDVEANNKEESRLLLLRQENNKGNNNKNNGGDSIIEDEDDDNEEGNPLHISFLYGVINSIICLPVMMSFTSIIYRDPAFAPYMPLLMKLTLVSAMVHQLCFSSLSSMKFAVGQVQDAGLIFLSSMASNIVTACRTKGYDDDVLLATSTIGLSLATLLLGAGLIIIGKLKLAQYVQKLPISVINGYLAYIGFFCGIAGVSLMMPPPVSNNDENNNQNNSESNNAVSLISIFENLEFILPGVLGGILIYLLVRKIGHISVLPSCITFMLVAFYALLWATQTTIADVTEDGWIPKTDPPPKWYHTWDYLRFDNVAWDVLPSQSLNLFGMTLIVALSSSLDVAAIEAELSYPLDYNSELTMVGISNMVSGATGGYTGSYIFSQTIFYLRSGIRSRWAGFCVALCEFVIVLLPFNILSYVPNFFFGSLLSMLCVDLMYEYLWEARVKLTKSEHAICLSTFLLIQMFGVEIGIVAGLLIQLIWSSTCFQNLIKGTNRTEKQKHSSNKNNINELGYLKAKIKNNSYDTDEDTVNLSYGSMSSTITPPLLLNEGSSLMKEIKHKPNEKRFAT